VAGELAPRIGARLPFQGSYTQHVIEREAPDVVARLTDAGYALAPGLVASCAACSAAVIPLLDAGEPIGSLVLVRRPEKQIFREDEIERAFSYGHLASLAFRKIHLLEDSERRREELQRVTESRARLMRGFSHDVKNPLGAADGYLSLLEDGIRGELADPQRGSIGHARRLLGSALELIDDLLELARAEAGQLEIELAPTDVREATREMTEEYRAQAEAAGLTLDLEVPAEISIIECDPTRVRQVVSNLLSNAIKYNSEKGHVLIRVEERERAGSDEPDAWVLVHVQDTGPGIPDEKRALLFQEFSRLRSNDAEGTGIGLAMAQKVAQALGGRVTLESEVGRGSVFSLWLPLRRVGERRKTAR
jgi:signal transduction histidine kinase